MERVCVGGGGSSVRCVWLQFGPIRSFSIRKNQRWRVESGDFRGGGVCYRADGGET